MTLQSLQKNKFLHWYVSKIANITALVFFLLLSYEELFKPTLIWSVQLFPNPIFDRTATLDHLWNFVTVVFFFALISYKKKSFFTAMIVCSFIYVTNEFLVELLVTVDKGAILELVYTLFLLTFVFIFDRKPLELSIFFIVQSLIYIYWRYMQIPWDCKGFLPYSNCLVNSPYIFDSMINFFTILVWFCDFLIGYLLFVYKNPGKYFI